MSNGSPIASVHASPEWTTCNIMLTRCGFSPRLSIDL